MKDIENNSETTVVVRGMGVFCPLGTDCDALEAALVEGRDSIGAITAFDASRFLTNQASAFGAKVDIKLDAGDADWMDRATLFTIAAYREAVAQAKLDFEELDATRIAVVLGSSHSGLIRTEDVARNVIHETVGELDPKVISATLVSHCTAVIKRISGAKGRVITVSSACASSNSAVGIAADLIRRGEADVVIAGGADTVSLSVMAGFNALRALAKDKTAPFAQDVGLSIGEGAGIVVLAKADLDYDQNAPYLAEVLGYGLSGDAHHATSPDQDGNGAVNAITAALSDAGISAEEIGYVNAHGTGTQANDGAESRAIQRVLGGKVPVSSTKSYYGHTLGASGVIETISSILLAKKGQVPANLRMEALREDCAPLNYVQSEVKTGAHATLLINNFGFGGNNSSLLVRVGAEESPVLRQYNEVDDVVITGVGVCSAAGVGMSEFEEALDDGSSLATLSAASGVAVAKCNAMRFTTSDLKPFARTSATSKFALVALKEALGEDKEIYRENQRSGLIGGIVFGAQKPTEKFMESVFLGDPALANAHYFPMITMNATGGATSLAFRIKGYTTTLCGSAAALAFAADLVQHDRQDRVAVVSGDETTPNLEQIYHRTGVVEKPDAPRIGRAKALGEFGGAITVERQSTARSRGAQILAHLKGWATRQDPLDQMVDKSGAALKRAVKAALYQAGNSPENITRVVVLGSGLAPTKTAVTNALGEVFSGNIPQTISPDVVFGFAPSSGALMTVAAALTSKSGVTLAMGYDVIGEGFAFVLEGVAQ